MLGLGFCWGQQVSIAGHILDKVHEGGAGVRTGSDVNNIAGAAQFKPGLLLSTQNVKIYMRISYFQLNFSDFTFWMYP